MVARLFARLLPDGFAVGEVGGLGHVPRPLVQLSYPSQQLPTSGALKHPQLRKKSGLRITTWNVCGEKHAVTSKQLIRPQSRNLYPQFAKINNK